MKITMVVDSGSGFIDDGLDYRLVHQIHRLEFVYFGHEGYPLCSAESGRPLQSCLAILDDFRGKENFCLKEAQYKKGSSVE